MSGNRKVTPEMATAARSGTENPIASASDAQPAASDDDRAKAEAEKAAEVDAHPGKGKFVLYLGPSNIARAAAADEFDKRGTRPGEGTLAEVTAAQWAEVGLGTKRTATHTWELSNDWRIPATDFSAEQIDYLLASRTPGVLPRFALVDADGKPVDR